MVTWNFGRTYFFTSILISLLYDNIVAFIFQSPNTGFDDVWSSNDAKPKT